MLLERTLSSDSRLNDGRWLSMIGNRFAFVQDRSLARMTVVHLHRSIESDTLFVTISYRSKNRRQPEEVEGTWAEASGSLGGLKLEARDTTNDGRARY